MNKMLLAGAATAGAAMILAASGANAAAIFYDFSAVPHRGNLGTTETYTVDGLSIVASGFNASSNPTDLYGKHGGGDENGLGMTNDPTGDNEIHYRSGFVQIDVSGLFGKVIPSSLQFGTNSTTDQEAWKVYGTNTAASLSAATQVASGSTEGVHALPGFGLYKYYDFVETGHHSGSGKNFLIASLSATSAVPEPATWAMMLVGFGGLGASLRRRRRAAASLPLTA